MDFEILVNQKHPLPKNYVPSNLVITDNNEQNFHHYKNENLKPMIHEVVFEKFKKLQEDASMDGVFVIIDSGYRSYEYQKKVFDSLVSEKGLEYAKKFVAQPGCSEHQTGLAFDFAVLRNGVYSDDIKEEDKESKWMKENAYRYGFILRYPKGKESITDYSFEPWHYRYVGEDLAKYIDQNRLTLEEYFLKNSIDRL